MAADLLERASVSQGEILLISDGADASDARTAAKLAQKGITTSVLAVGTREGSPIPSGAGFVSDAQGNVVITRLEQESLKAVASAGNGELSRLEAISNQASPWIGSEGGKFMLRDDALGERWKDIGPWLVLLLLPFVAVGFRRALLFAWPVLFLPGLLVSQTARADIWDDLWQRRDQQAQSALKANKADVAAGLAIDPSISGEAFYRAEDYPGAIQSWSRSAGEDCWYNQGNALALAGDLDGAITAYDRALSSNPEMEDALFNRALVEQLKQQQEQDQEGDQGENSKEQTEGARILSRKANHAKVKMTLMRKGNHRKESSLNLLNRNWKWPGQKKMRRQWSSGCAGFRMTPVAC